MLQNLKTLFQKIKYSFSRECCRDEMIERGWFLWIEDEWFKEFAHRIHTSTIENVEYLDDGIIVTTQNTRFTFKLLEG